MKNLPLEEYHVLVDYQNITGYWYTQHFFYSTTSNIICYDTKTAAVSSENIQQNKTLNL
jgi:hypothetical protein